MSSNKQSFKGKKWCEYCKTGINWTKEDIAYHEQSKTHKKNMEREIEFKRQKRIREQEEEKNKANMDESSKIMQEIEKKAEEAMRNQSKQNYNYQQSGQLQNYGSSSIGPQMPVYNKQPELTDEQKKELKKQKKREELGSEFGSSYEESDSDEERDENFDEDEIKNKLSEKKVDFEQKFDRVWYLSKDEKTGKLFFYNQLSRQRKYEKPIGLKLLDEEQRLWDEYMLKQIEEKEKEEEAEIEEMNQKVYDKRKTDQIDKIDEKEDKNEESQDNNQKQNQPNKFQVNEKEGIIQSEWVEVTEEDNFFNKYAIKNVYGEVLDQLPNQDEEEDGDDDMDEKEVAKIARIELQIESGKIQNNKQMMEALLLEETQGGNTSKQNEKMKKLIERNLDVQSNRQQQVYKKKNWLEEENEQEQNKNKPPQTASVNQQNSQEPTKAETKGSMFKKRINNNKNVQNIAIDD